MLRTIEVNGNTMVAVLLEDLYDVSDATLYSDALAKMFSTCISIEEAKEETSSETLYFIFKLIESFKQPKEKGGCHV